MSDLRQDLINSKDPEMVVGLAIQGLYDSITHLNALRMSNDTADFVLRDWRDLEVAEQMLSDLLHDLHMATRRAAE